MYVREFLENWKLHRLRTHVIRKMDYFYKDVNDKGGCKYKRSMVEEKQEDEHGKARG